MKGRPWGWKREGGSMALEMVLDGTKGRELLLLLGGAFA